MRDLLLVAWRKLHSVTTGEQQRRSFTAAHKPLQLRLGCLLFGGARLHPPWQRLPGRTKGPDNLAGLLRIFRIFNGISFVV